MTMFANPQKTVSERSLVVHPRKRNRSSRTKCNSSLDSLAFLTTSVLDNSKRGGSNSTKSNQRTVTRKRSRPRPLYKNGQGEESLMNPMENAFVSANQKVLKVQKKDERLKLRKPISPRREGCHSRRKNLESSDESEVEDLSESVDNLRASKIDPMPTSKLKCFVSPDSSSSPKFGNSIRRKLSLDSSGSISSRLEMQMANEREASERKRDTWDNADDSYQDSLTSIKEVERRIQRIVSPSPKKIVHRNLSKKGERKRKSTTSQNGSKSTVSSKRSSRLVRVSKLKINSRKKPQIVLARAMTVGKKTIPKRQIDKPAKKVREKNEDSLKFSKHKDRSAPSKAKKKTEIGSRSVQEYHDYFDTHTSFNGGDNMRHSTEDLSIPKKEKRKGPSSTMEVTDEAEGQMSENTNNLDSVTPWENDSTEVSKIVSMKKKKLLGFVDQLMKDLEKLKTQIGSYEDNDLVEVDDLQKDSYVLKEADILCPRRSELRTCRKDEHELSPAQQEPLNRWINPMLPPARTPLLNQFSNSDDESECSYDSVIDLGVVSDSRALIRYAKENTSANYGDDDDDSYFSKRDIDSNVPNRSRISRLNTNSDILVSIGHLNGGVEASGHVPETNATSKPSSKTNMALSVPSRKGPKDGNLPLARKLDLKEREDSNDLLISMDWEECFKNEMAKRALQRSPDKENKFIDSEDTRSESSSSDNESYLDALMMAAPTLEF
jgi:hypothetical protein